MLVLIGHKLKRYTNKIPTIKKTEANGNLLQSAENTPTSENGNETESELDSVSEDMTELNTTYAMKSKLFNYSDLMKSPIFIKQVV